MINKEFTYQAILKYEFPQIENIKLELGIGYSYYFSNLQLQQKFEQFFNKIKENVTELSICDMNNCHLKRILSLRKFAILNLTRNFIGNEVEYNKFTDNLAVISNHDSLKNIKINLIDAILNGNIFYNIITLSNKMPNTKIQIEITARVKGDDLIKKNIYEKKLNENKHLLNPFTKLSLSFAKINHY